MLINGRFLTRVPWGPERHALELVGALARRGELAGARVVLPPGAPLVAVPPVGIPVSHQGLFVGPAWEQLDLPRLAGDEWLVGLCGTGPMRRQRQLVLIHDVAVHAAPDGFPYGMRLWAGVLHRALMKHAACVAAVSRFGAGELLRHLGGRATRIEVLGESGEHVLQAPADRSVYEPLDLRGRRYVLALDDARAHRNLAAVLAAVTSLGDRAPLLVLVSGSGPGAFTARGRALPPGTCHAGRPTLAQMRALYEGAAAFVLPSHLESSGLLPLEAMCCGCPVIVAQRGALPEVCAEAALYCDSADPATLATQLRRLLASSHLAHELRAAGLERARLQTWDAAARGFSELGQRLAR